MLLCILRKLKNKLKHLVHEVKLSYVILQSKRDPHSAGKLWR